MGAILGSCLSSCTMNWAGRKLSIILSGIIFFLSFLLIGLASIFSSVEMILIGRALSGVGVGLAVPSTAIYIAECSSSGLRGTLSSLPAFFMAMGVLIGYVFGIFLSWHYLAYFCSTPAVVLVFSMMLLPESPTYLARKGEEEKAARSLAWLRGTSVEVASKEIFSLSNEKDNPKTETSTTFLRSFFSYQNLCPLFLTLVLHFLQSWSGVNVIVFKTVHVFETVGSSVDKYTCTAIVGVVQLLSTGVSITLVDKAGRRPLLMVSGMLMTISMGSLAVFMYFASSIPDGLGWIPLVSIILAFIGYSVGFATIPFCIMGEVLPARTRNISGAISSTFNLASLFLVLKFYTSLADIIDYYGVYCLFAGVNMFGVIFVFCFLPETKGKSLKEIEEIFSK